MFADRVEAGRLLAARLERYRGAGDAVILAIPRGGVVTGSVLARELSLPLDVILTKKIGHPLDPEYAIGVVSLTGQAVDREALAREGIAPDYIAGETSRIRGLLRRRDALYRSGRAPLVLRGKTAIVVDDGIATGNTMREALVAAREEGAARTVAAAPVASPRALSTLAGEADEVVCVLAPEEFLSIGRHYRNFDPVEDEEAIRLLSEAAGALRNPR